MRAAWLVATALLLLSACGSSAGAAKQTEPAASASVTVEIKNYAFTPSTITIRAGQAVQWNFDDSGIAHNVSGDDGLETPDLTSGTYRHAFAHPGTFSYRCTLHAAMQGRVIVQ